MDPLIVIAVSLIEVEQIAAVVVALVVSLGGYMVGSRAMAWVLRRQLAQIHHLRVELGLQHVRFGEVAGSVNDVHVRVALDHPFEPDPNVGLYYIAALFAALLATILTAPLLANEVLVGAWAYLLLTTSAANVWTAWQVLSRAARASITEVEVEAIVPQVPDLTVRPRARLSTAGLTSGDAEFDRRFVISGDEVEAQAHLAPCQRQALARVDDTMRLEEGVVKRSLQREDGDCVAHVREAVSLAAQVGRRRSTAVLLAERVRHERGPPRLRALVALVRVGGDTAQAAVCEVLREQGVDPDDGDEVAAYLGRHKLYTLAALHRLREIGTVAAFPAMDALDEAWSTRVADVRAIIASRVSPTAAGGLTLTDVDPRGGLSKVEGHRGELSIAAQLTSN